MVNLTKLTICTILVLLCSTQWVDQTVNSNTFNNYAKYNQGNEFQQDTADLNQKFVLIDNTNLAASVNSNGELKIFNFKDHSDHNTQNIVKLKQIANETIDFVLSLSPLPIIIGCNNFTTCYTYNWFLKSAVKQFTLPQNKQIQGVFWKKDKSLLVIGAQQFNFWVYSFIGDPKNDYIATEVNHLYFNYPTKKIIMMNAVQTSSLLSSLQWHIVAIGLDEYQQAYSIQFGLYQIQKNDEPSMADYSFVHQLEAHGFIKNVSTFAIKDNKILHAAQTTNYVNFFNHLSQTQSNNELISALTFCPNFELFITSQSNTGIQFFDRDITNPKFTLSLANNKITNLLCSGSSGDLFIVDVDTDNSQTNYKTFIKRCLDNNKYRRIDNDQCVDLCPDTMDLESTDKVCYLKPGNTMQSYFKENYDPESSSLINDKKKQDQVASSQRKYKYVEKEGKYVVFEDNHDGHLAAIVVVTSIVFIFIMVVFGYFCIKVNRQ